MSIVLDSKLSGDLLLLEIIVKNSCLEVHVYSGLIQVKPGLHLNFTTLNRRKQPLSSYEIILVFDAQVIILLREFLTFTLVSSLFRCLYRRGRFGFLHLMPQYLRNNIILDLV